MIWENADQAYLVMMLNASASVANSMNETFNGTSGMAWATAGMRSSRVNDKIPVSQKVGPCDGTL